MLRANGDIATICESRHEAGGRCWSVSVEITGVGERLDCAYAADELLCVQSRRSLRFVSLCGERDSGR